jgi:hypothetical protein
LVSPALDKSARRRVVEQTERCVEDGVRRRGRRFRQSAATSSAGWCGCATQTTAVFSSTNGSKSLLRASGEHGKDRTVVLGGLEGPVGLAAGSGGTVYLTEAFAARCRRPKPTARKP